MMIEITPQEQKLLLRKVLSLFERDALMEFFKLRVENQDGRRVFKIEAHRADRPLRAESRRADFREVLQELRDQLLAQLPQRPEPRLGSQGEEAAWSP